MHVKPLSRAIEFRAINQKRELSKAWKALMEASKDVDSLREEIRWWDKAHTIERAKFSVELERLSKVVEEVTWDATNRSSQSAVNSVLLEERFLP